MLIAECSIDIINGVIASTKTYSRIFLTEPHSNRRGPVAPCLHPAPLLHKPVDNIQEHPISLDINSHIPQSLPNNTAPDPYFLLDISFVGGLGPHAGFPTDDIRIGSWDLRGEVVHVTPAYVGLVRVTQLVAHPHVQVGEVVVRQDYLVLVDF